LFLGLFVFSSSFFVSFFLSLLLFIILNLKVYKVRESIS
jgi:hypothetical protein